MATAVAESSYVCGTSGAPLLHRTVDGVLKAALAAGPARPALVVSHQARRYSFAELDAEVERVARGFLACGLRPGSVSASGRRIARSGS